MRRYEPKDRTPPGETLSETMEAAGLSASALAARAGLSPHVVSALLASKIPLTTKTAAKLETTLGVPVIFWRKLDANYRAVGNAVTTNLCQ